MITNYDEQKDFQTLLKRRMEHGGTVVTMGHLGSSDIEKIRATVKGAVYNEMDKTLLDNHHRPEAREQIERFIKDKVLSEGNNLPRLMRPKLMELAEDIMDEVLGFGPIQELLNDPEITEVMVNGPHQVYVEKNGLLKLTDVKFQDNKHVMNIIERIVSRIGRRVDESQPLVDARLPDGSRVNVIIPPLALSGPTITIRKFPKDHISIEDLVVRYGSLTCREAMLFKICVEAQLNIIVSGGTGSGKTTTLNALSAFIPEDERIVTIEDAAELRMQQPHVISLESRPPNIEGKGQISIRDLVRNALRMRPDRIVVGEVRSVEAFDMLQAMNTGHEGSLTTGHANTARDILGRLESMVLMAFDLPIRPLRAQIASGIDMIIHQDRLRDGRRRITEVVLVEGLDGEEFKTKDVLKYDMSLDKLVLAEGFKALEELFQKRGINIPNWVRGEIQ